MRRVALIGGTGALRLVPPDALPHAPLPTPCGEHSPGLVTWRRGETDVLFLPRHGSQGAIAPHLVNYRANVWALRSLKPDAVVGINAVGGIAPRAVPGRIVIPAQLIDYTWGRLHTFHDGTVEPLRHVEFDPPFDEPLRGALLAAAASAGLDVVDGGTYAVTQGPRLETAAEIDRLAAAGCDIVGMTAMPEAALAREAGLHYALCAVVVNHAAGRLPAGSSIHAELGRYVETGLADIERLLAAFLA